MEFFNSVFSNSDSDPAPRQSRSFEDLLHNCLLDLEELGSEVVKKTAAFRNVIPGLPPIDPPEETRVPSEEGKDDHNNNRVYNRYEVQLAGIKSDLNTYCVDPENEDDYAFWQLDFSVYDKRFEIEHLMGENRVIGEFYGKLVPKEVDQVTFWSRYFYRVDKLGQVDELAKRVISQDDQDLTWDDHDENLSEDARSIYVEVDDNEKLADTELSSESDLSVISSKLASNEEESYWDDRVDSYGARIRMKLANVSKLLAWT